MDITFRIRRYNPEAGSPKPYWQEFALADVEPTQRVLELLHRVKWEQDGTLAFRRSCSSGICGSDAMRINGRNALACKLLARDVGDRIQVEPILGLHVIKDLIVDMEPFLAHYRQVLPWFVNDGPLPADGRERPAIAGGQGPHHRHDKLHPLCGLHHFLPQLLGQRGIRRPGGHCAGASLSLRHARHGR